MAGPSNCFAGKRRKIASFPVRMTNVLLCASLLKHRAAFCPASPTPPTRQRTSPRIAGGRLPDGGGGCFRADRFVRNLWALQTVIHAENLLEVIWGEKSDQFC